MSSKKPKKKITTRVANEERRPTSSQRREWQDDNFGLEPPKRYRHEDSVLQPDDIPAYSERKKSSKKKASKSSHSSKKSHKRNKRNDETPITPQDRKRLQHEKRKKKKLIRKIIGISGVVALIGVVIIVLCFTLLFNIDNIVIEGNTLYSEQQIISVLPVQKGDNLLRSDLKGASQKLEEYLPYIKQAEVKEKFPSTLKVNITEADKIYYVKNADKSYMLLDSNLKVLDMSAAKKPKTSIAIKKFKHSGAVTGKVIEIENEKLKEDLLVITSTIDNMKLEKITAICSENAATNYMIYDGRIKMKLGDTSDIENKVYLLLTALESLNESDPDAQGEFTISGDKRVYFTEK